MNVQGVNSDDLFVLESVVNDTVIDGSNGADILTGGCGSQ